MIVLRELERMALGGRVRSPIRSCRRLSSPVLRLYGMFANAEAGRNHGEEAEANQRGTEEH